MSIVLGCTAQPVSFNELSAHVAALLQPTATVPPERTCVQLATQSVPLCEDDVRAVQPRAPLRGLYERLASTVESCSRRDLPRSTHGVVREVLAWSMSAMGCCTELMGYLDATGFKEGFLDFDRATRGVLDELTGVLAEVVQKGPYAATPLLLMAVLVEGGLSGTLAALLQGRSLAELTRRGALFYQLLQLLRTAAQLPDTAQLLARPVRLGSVQASVLGSMASLAEGPAARLLLDCDNLRSRAVTSLAAASGADDPQLQLQVRMARKIRDTHALLASAVEAAATRASFAASAALPAPAEAQQLDSLIRELQAARVSGRAGGGGDGAWAGEGVRGGSSAYAGLTAAGASASSGVSGSYGYEHQYSASRATGNTAVASASSGGGQYAYGSTGRYEQAHAPPAAVEHMYSLSSPLADASRPGSAATAPAGGRSFDYSGDAGGVSAEAVAAEAAVTALRVQRELQRLHAATEAVAAARARAADGGGGGLVMGVVGAGFARDAWGHKSQAQLAAPPYGGDPLASSTATMTYPWQREYVELYGGSGANTAGISNSSSSRQQPAGQPAAPASPQQAWPAAQHQASPAAYSAAYDRDTRSAGSGATLGPSAPTGQHLGGHSALAGDGEYAAARARMMAHSSGGSGASVNGGVGGYAELSLSGRASAAGATAAPAPAAAAAAAASSGRPGSAVRLRMREEAAPPRTAAPASLLAGTAVGRGAGASGTDLLQSSSRRDRDRDQDGLLGERSTSRPRTYGQVGSYGAASPQLERARDPSSAGVTWMELQAGGPEPAAPQAAAAAATWPRGMASSGAARAASTSRVRTVNLSVQEPPPPSYDRPSPRQQPASGLASVASTAARAVEPAQTRSSLSSRDDVAPSAAPDPGRAFSRGRGAGAMTASITSRAEPVSVAPAPAASPSASPGPSPARHRHVSSQQLVADTDRALELYDEAQLQRAIQLSKQEAARAALAAAGVTGRAGGRDRDRGMDGDRDRGRDVPSPSPSPRPSSSLRSSSPLQLEHRSRVGDAATPKRAAGDQATAVAAGGGVAAAAAVAAGRPGSSATPVRRRLTDREAEAAAATAAVASPRRTEAQAPSISQPLATTTEEAGSSSGGMLVSERVPLTALHQRYADLLPLLCAKLVSLEDDFPTTRRVAGDGNCFYRAALFGLLEHVLAAPDPQLAERLDLVVSRHLARLDEPQFQQQTTTTTTTTNSSSDGRGADVSPLRSARGGPAGSPAPAPASPGRPGEDGAAAAPVPPRDDPAAYRGGQRLLRLLRTAWFKCPDAPRPSDVYSLESLFNSADHSGEVIRFARSLTARELMAAEDFYTPFIPGCGGDYTGLSLRQICERHVLPMGVEVEQLQIIAACTAMGVTLAVLDVAGSAVGAIKHGPAAQQHGPPVAWVAHLPGHYDVIYPARPLDVAPGGQLVVADK